MKVKEFRKLLHGVDPDAELCFQLLEFQVFQPWSDVFNTHDVSVVERNTVATGEKKVVVKITVKEEEN